MKYPSFSLKTIRRIFYMYIHKSLTCTYTEGRKKKIEFIIPIISFDYCKGPVKIFFHIKTYFHKYNDSISRNKFFEKSARISILNCKTLTWLVINFSEKNILRSYLHNRRYKMIP